MKSVKPKPRRAAFSVLGVTGVGLGTGFFLSSFLTTAMDFGRRWVGFGAEEFSPVTLPVGLGRVVMNAPRTSSSCWARTTIEANPANKIAKLRTMAFILIAEIL